MGGLLKNDPVNPYSSLSSTFSSAFNISPDTFITSQVLQTIVLVQGLMSSAYGNSEGNIYKLFIYTQVINILFST